MIIVGLGNIGKEYENTRHNIGFMCIDVLADKLGVKFKTKECKAETAVLYKGDEKVVLAKPQTYMNLSGNAVKELMGKYKETADNVVIIYDDIDMDLAKVRARKEGSGGTHNGMKNIVEMLKTKSIPRIRVGIGRPVGGMDLASFVLSKFSKEDKDALNVEFENISDALVQYIKDKDFAEIQRVINH